MTKLLLLGLGRWGNNHLRVLHRLPIELYVAEIDPKRWDAARKLGLPEDRLTTRHRDFLDCIDAAVVVTPAQTHFPLVKEFIEAGKDVFVEKPITLISTEAQALAELAEARKRILQVGHIFRFDPATEWLRQQVAQGRFGRVQMLRSQFSGFKRPRNDSGVAFADAIHFIDLINYILGSRPTSVHAVYQDFLGRGMEDAALISMQYASEGGPVWGIVEANYFIPGKYRDLVVTGSQLSAMCDFNVAQYKIKTYENRHQRAGADFAATEGIVQQVECPPEEPLLAELSAFVDSIQTRQSPRATGWDGFQSVRILEAAARSAITGQTIAL